MANTLTPPYLFGGSYDALAGQRLAYDNANIGLAQSDLAARQRAQDIARRNAEYLQSQMDADAARADAATERGNAAALGQYQFGVQQANQRRAEGLELQRESDKTAWNQKLFDAQTKQQSEQGDYNEVTRAIDAGKIDDAALIPKLFPNLSELDRKKAETYLSAAQQQVGDNYTALDAAAKAATAQLKAKKTVPMKPGGLFSKEVPASVPTITEEDAVNTLATMPQFKQAANALRWDEGLQSFVPIVRKPKGYQSPAGLAMVPPPPARDAIVTTPAPMSPPPPPDSGFAFAATPDWSMTPPPPAAPDYSFAQPAVAPPPPPVTVSTNRNRVPGVPNRKYIWQPGGALLPVNP